MLYRDQNIILGCMRIADKPIEEVKDLIQTALDLGINFFDHANIYGQGKSEKVFAKAIDELGIDRSSIIIQSKCGIDAKTGTYNFSKTHIIEETTKILERLNTDYIDILLLHRPDALMDFREVNEAFHYLFDKGMVKAFGVSNQSSTQMEMMKKYIDFPLRFNQVQFSLMHSHLIDAGIQYNMGTFHSQDFLLEYARTNQIQLQAWSPFFSGFFEDIFIDNPKFPEVNEKLDELALKYDVSKEAISVAWILRHPVNFQVVVGTTRSDRLKKIAQAKHIQLSHQDWYDLYKASGKMLP